MHLAAVGLVPYQPPACKRERIEVPTPPPRPGVPGVGGSRADMEARLNSLVDNGPPASGTLSAKHSVDNSLPPLMQASSMQLIQAKQESSSELTGKLFSMLQNLGTQNARTLDSANIAPPQALAAVQQIANPSPNADAVFCSRLRQALQSHGSVKTEMKTEQRGVKREMKAEMIKSEVKSEFAFGGVPSLTANLRPDEPPPRHAIPIDDDVQIVGGLDTDDAPIRLPHGFGAIPEDILESRMRAREEERVRRIKSTQPCRFGRSCKKRDCPNMHGEGRQIDNEVNLCAFGRRCKRKDCFYDHPEGREIDKDPTKGVCKWGARCKRADCLYDHPQGREPVSGPDLRICFFCQSAGHIASDCPQNPESWAFDPNRAKERMLADAPAVV